LKKSLTFFHSVAPGFSTRELLSKNKGRDNTLSNYSRKSFSRKNFTALKKPWFYGAFFVFFLKEDSF